jgi:hypothetical protein
VHGAARQELEPLEIRSFRTVFDLERRIYRVDRLRLNPQGVPVRGVVYALAIVCVLAACERLPAVGTAIATVPWYARDVAVPAGLAALLAALRIDGRPFHLAARAMVRLAAGPRYVSGLARAHPPGRVWAPPDLLLLPDGSDSRLRRLRFVGPGAVLVAAPHERALWRRGVAGRVLRHPDLTLRSLGAAVPGGRAQVLEVARGARLETRAGRG